MDVRRVLRESQSIGVKQAFDDEEDEKDKDSMIFNKNKRSINAWDIHSKTNNQTNELSLSIEVNSKVRKLNINSKVGSREGSKKNKA